MSSVQKFKDCLEPSMVLPTKMNSRERLTPVTISGLVMGMLVRLMTTLRIFGFMLWIPTAATVPKTVAMRLESTATRTELPSRDSRVSSRKSRAYCWKVKPSKRVISLPVLKEARISTAIGAYRNTNMRIVSRRFVFFIR